MVGSLFSRCSCNLRGALPPLDSAAEERATSDGAAGGVSFDGFLSFTIGIVLCVVSFPSNSASVASFAEIACDNVARSVDCNAR